MKLIDIPTTTTPDPFLTERKSASDDMDEMTEIAAVYGVDPGTPGYTALRTKLAILKATDPALYNKIVALE